MNKAVLNAKIAPENEGSGTLETKTMPEDQGTGNSDAQNCI